MTTTIELNANELDFKVFEALKTMFKGRNIRLTIDTTLDETEYLTQSEANVKMLKESIAQLRSGNIKSITAHEL